MTRRAAASLEPRRRRSPETTSGAGFPAPRRSR